jgi:hypothetical protein
MKEEKMFEDLIKELKAEIFDSEIGKDYYANTAEIKAEIRGKIEGLTFAIKLLEKEEN